MFCRHFIGVSQPRPQDYFLFNGAGLFDSSGEILTVKGASRAWVLANGFYVDIDARNPGAFLAYKGNKFIGNVFENDVGELLTL